ncbi:MAG: response regulator [Chloroflexi bacterium]|nr:response regulator [Chloroflexota bacterium]
MSQGTVSIVIIDDEVDHAIIIRRVLVDVAPYAAVDVMTDPRKVEERLAEAPIHALLLMDRLLAGRQSIELIPALLCARPDLSIALLSAALSEEDRDRALATGALAAVEKPATLDGWRVLLRDLLGLHRARSVA